MDLGYSWGGTGLVTCDLRTSESPTLQRMLKNIGHNLPEQLAGSSSRSGCNWGAAVEADLIGEQQPKRTQSGNS